MYRTFFTILSYCCVLYMLSYTNARAQSIVTIDPSKGLKSSFFPVTITGTGTNWQYAGYYYNYFIDLSFSGTNVYGYAGTVMDTVTMSAWVEISNIAPSGFRDVIVQYYDGVNWDYYTLPSGFEVLPSQLIAIQTDNAEQGSLFPVTITGRYTNWQSPQYYPAFINLRFSGGDIITDNEIVVNDTVMTADMAISSNATIGKRTVYVDYDDGSGLLRTDSLEEGFTIVQPLFIDRLLKAEKKSTIYYNLQNQTILIGYLLQRKGDVKIDLFDVSGKLILSRTLHNVAAGIHINELSIANRLLPGGLYLLKLDMGGRVFAEKLYISNR